jgi:hypothetical protein
MKPINRPHNMAVNIVLVMALRGKNGKRNDTPSVAL